MINTENIYNLSFDEVDYNDYPDFSDAYISEAWIIENNTERQLTDEELQELNDDRDYVYEKLLEHIL